MDGDFIRVSNAIISHGYETFIFIRIPGITGQLTRYLDVRGRGRLTIFKIFQDFIIEQHSQTVLPTWNQPLPYYVFRFILSNLLPSISTKSPDFSGRLTSAFVQLQFIRTRSVVEMTNFM